MEDKFYMQRVLELAQQGKGKTSPNPLVGTVIVKNNRIISEGYHRSYGDKHAEVVAMENAGEDLSGATLYCNLEPCSHNTPEKKTPPCTQRIIQENIRRVVIAGEDPNPLVNGSGIRQLRENGIIVDVLPPAEDSRRLNEKYFKFIKTGKPFIHLKIAQSLDGRIATASGSSQWVTNQSAIRLVHEWRAEYDAVLVGANTVMQDNPSLNVRLVEGRHPYRVVLDNRLLIPDQAHLISDELRHRTIIFTTQNAGHPRVSELMKKEIQVISLPPDSRGLVPLEEAMQRLAELKIASVLVEGGGEVFTSFIRQRLFDKISVFIAPKIIGSGIESIGDLGIQTLQDAYNLEAVSIKIIDNQALMEGYQDYHALFENQGTAGNVYRHY
ncbi:MAG: bifunctional diaminohydroxyphosphoribosylaminopyrimidine deaminase/5-amino-6-(5-phosphoribosylamino)uracil reductase RibD [Calditrichia bacterium]